MKKLLFLLAFTAIHLSCTKSAAPPLEPHDTYYRLSMKDKNTQEYVVVEVVGVKEYISESSDDGDDDDDKDYCKKHPESKKCRPLPVTIDYFAVRVTKSYTYVEWKTSYEDNIEYFQVEKSLDGYKWLPAGKQIKPKGIGVYTVKFY